MARTSQNGWPVVSASAIDNGPILGEVFPNGFLAGDVKKAFVWLFTQLNNRVEKIDNGLPRDEWGWYVKNIEGSATISNHASGTAGDYNARFHPMGVRNTYNASQRAEIHKILAEARGVFRWGGDYTGRPDDMHFEINVGRTTVNSFVHSLEQKEEDMPSVTEIWAIHWGVGTRRETAGDKLVYVDQTVETLETQVTTLTEKVTDLSGKFDELKQLIVGMQ